MTPSALEFVVAPLQSQTQIGAVDYSHCLIPKTHRRLVEAHILWHQSLDRYQEPEVFQANVTATIQALRNVTFVLQSEKHVFSQFQGWYGVWQERIKADVILKWLVAARNIVVKEGDLDTASTAIVKLVTWRDHILLESTIPPGTPAALILRNIPILEMVSRTHCPPEDLEDAAVIIERRWSVPELKGQEILEALAHAYGVLSDLVLDAHVTLGNTTCISTSEAHSHFRSTYHRHGTLPCMTLGIERRTYSAQLKTGNQVQMGRTVHSADPAIAARRYGLGHADQLPDWQRLDPLVIAERVLHTAMRMLRKDKALLRILFIRQGNGVWRQVVVAAENRTEKHLVMRMAARFIESVGGDAVIDVGEIWLIPPHETAIKAHFGGLADVPGRREAISVLVATRDGLLKNYITPFTRGPFGGIRVGITDEAEDECPYYLKPVIDVWLAQGWRVTSEGKRIRQVWQPDPLDTCFCGGPQRFGECCKPLLDRAEHRSTVMQEIGQAAADRDMTRWEQLARAELAQYVIWVRQHTAPTQHVAPAVNRMLLEVDVPALTAHVRQLGEVLIAAGRCQSFVEQLTYMATIIGVPECSVRLTALAALWLFEMGQYSDAARKVESLGNLDLVGDPVALMLASQLFDLTQQKKTQYLTRAATTGVWEYERWPAGIELAQHLCDCNDRDGARRQIGTIIAALKEKGSQEAFLADALRAQWKITREESDYQAAKTALENCLHSERLMYLAAIAIDHGDYEEAEGLLGESALSGDQLAQLLVVEARIRGNKIESGREMLRQIAADTIAPRLAYPYAVACAHVAVACGDDQCRRDAAARLRGLPVEGTGMATGTTELVQMLEAPEIPVRRSRLHDWRGVLGRWR